jgi:hypothetical protein
VPTVGGPELLIILLWLLPLVVGVLALIDLAQRPEGQLEAAGQSKTVWLIVAVLSLFVPCVFLGAAYYLLAVRPKLPPRRTA